MGREMKQVVVIPEHHRTSCVRPVLGQGQGEATGIQRDKIRKKELRLEEGQGVGRGFLLVNLVLIN